MKCRIILILFALVLGLSWLGIYHAPVLTPIALAEELVSKPGEYSGYSPALYDGYKLFSQYVTVRDGTKLAVDYFRPTLNGQVVNSPLPVVWMHTPYQRRNYPSNTTNLAAALYPGAALGLVNYGYVVAVVDQRGLYASYGIRYTGNFWDAYDITEWFAVQPWSDGKIGMWGCSATGGSQVAAANLMPPSLKAIFPMSCGFSYNREASLPPAWPLLPPPGSLPGSIPASDVYAVRVDGDTDGFMLNAAKQDHRYNYLGTGAIANSLDQIEQSGVAMYNAANWVDIMPFPRDTFFRFNNLANPGRLLMGPGGHCIWWTQYSPKLPPLNFNIVAEEHRFFDYWLKGIDNGILEEPPIYFFTYNASAGQDWRFAWQWPIPNGSPANFYLGPGPAGYGFGVNDGTLSTTSPTVAGAKDVYTTDYSIKTEIVTDPYGLRWITQPLASTKGLTYTTGPLTSDLEVTGHPVVHLWISSTATDGDFIVDIEDIAQNGSATSIITASGSPSFGIIAADKPLPDGINGIRASSRTLNDPPFNNGGLPWHRNFPEDMKPLTPNEPAELVFDLRPVSYIFKAGHRIRLVITAVCGDATPRLNPPPVVSFYRNSTYSSYITLPINGPVAANVRIEPKILNNHSHGHFTALVQFPKTLDKGYVKDINLESIQCNGATAVSARLFKDTLIAKFNIQDLTNIATGHTTKMTVKGEFGNKFNYGQITFEGSDTVRVIGN